jgi:uncharacterized Zn finger protein
MKPTSASQPCPCCGGTLDFKITVETLITGAPVDFFRCEHCGYVNAVERRTTDALSSDPLALPEAGAKRKRA